MNSIACTQCKQPLCLDASLVDLAPSAYDMMAGSLPRSHHTYTTEVDKLSQLPAPTSAKEAWQSSVQSPPNSLSAHVHEKRAPGIQIPGESFVLLQDSIVRNIPSPPNASPSRQTRLSFTSRTRANPTSAPSSKRNASPSPSKRPQSSPTQVPPSPSPLSHHLESTARLFKLLSSRTDLDHPLCTECTHILLTTLRKQLEETKKERDGYIAFEKEIKKEKDREKDSTSREAAGRKIQRLKEDEAAAVEELKVAEREREKLDVEMNILEREEKELEVEEAELVYHSCMLSRTQVHSSFHRFWRAHNAHLLVSAQQTSQLRSLRAAYAADAQTLEKLERTNVYYDAFCIGNVGVFGTINGLRLGRASGFAVRWRCVSSIQSFLTSGDP